MTKQKNFSNGSAGFTQHFQEPLINIVDRFERKSLAVPYYQRDFCWTDDKVRQWGLSILSGDLGYGTIAVYSLPDEDAPLWLCDGRQRVGATILVRDDPERYGLGDQREKIKERLQRVLVNVQSRVLEGHEEGLVFFQNLNQGTAAHPLEYYKGEINKHAQAEGLIEKVTGIIEASQKMVCRVDKSVGRDRLLSFQRGSIALFYQYASETPVSDFWAYVSPKVTTTREPVERLLARWIEKKRAAEIKQEIKNFERFVDDVTQEVRAIVNEVKGREEGMVKALFRCILHLAIWRRNTRVPGESYRKLVCAAIQHSDNLTARIMLVQGDQFNVITMGMTNLGGWRKLSKLIGVEWNLKRKSRPSTLPGIEHSHVAPFSKMGEGKTILENGPENRRRGARPISEDR